MRYDFKCPQHGFFEVEQSIHAEHVAFCPTCGKPADRIYRPLTRRWGNPLFKPDGTYDHDPLFEGAKSPGRQKTKRR